MTRSQTRDHSLPLVGIDVGGTFTDFVLLDRAGLRIHKAPTTPDDQSRAIVDGLASLTVSQAEIVHGMTVATNALLERRGARTALIASAGFADVLVIGRQNRPHLYRLSQARPAPLVEDAWRLEVRERLDAAGDVLEPLDAAAVAALGEKLAASDVESLAVALLFAFRNPAHEQAVAAILRAVCPNLPISLSSDILPEYREYERTATTVINAYVQPVVGRYMARLARALEGSQIRILQSNGGAIGLDQAAAQPARLVLSGPAGGVVGAFAVARQALDGAAPRLITLDMGGTSSDVALCPGLIPTTAESVIADLPLRLPVIDIHTVGAGGGSIAAVDAGGGLRVGPASAGALPGPACYGRGGTEPTVTDANLVLGRLAPQGFLGGQSELRLDLAAARAVMATLGTALGLSPEAAALGVVRIANATMERALRRVSVERGHDPRAFILLPFGGAGPLHACDLADTLGIRRILVPPIPGVLSAYGMLVADVAYDLAQTVLGPAAVYQADPAPLSDTYTRLATRVADVLHQEGVAAPRMAASLDLRYRGQSYELTVPLALPITPDALHDTITAFHQAHAQRYGYAMEDEPVEVVTLRVAGHGPGAQPDLPTYPLTGADASPAQVGEQAIWFNPDAPQTAPLYDRARLAAGNRLAGPALILQYDATVVVTPGWQGRVDTMHNLWLER